MKPTTRKILLVLAGVVAALAAVLAVAGAVAWTHREAIVESLAHELGVDNIDVTGIGFDRKAATLTVELQDVSLHGINVRHMSVALDLGRLLRERHLGFSEVILADLDMNADLLRAALAPGPAADDAEASLENPLDAVWARARRFGRVRIENARFDLTPIGIPGAILVEHAALVRQDGGRFFAAEAEIQQQVAGHALAGTLLARAEIFYEDGTLKIRAAHAEIKHFDAPMSYFAFFDTKLVDVPILPIDAVTADAHLEIGPHGDTILVAIEHIDLLTAAATATGAFTIDAGAKTTSYDVHVAIERGDQRVLFFLPIELLGRAPNDWLAGNIKATTVTKGSLELAGDSAALKVLALRLPAHDTTLTFAPGWPAVTDTDALVVIGPDSLHVEGTHGTLEGLEIKAFQVDIASFAAPVVKVRAQAVSDARTTLAALAKSPLRATIDTITSQPLVLDGPLGATVEVEADISGPEPQVRVAGTAELRGVKVAATDARLPPFEGVRGKVTFTAERIAAEALTGTFDGAPATVKADVAFDAKKLVVHGDVRATLPSRAGRFLGPTLAHVKGELRAGLGGRALSLRYSATGDLDLAGVEVAVPGVLSKPAGAARRAKFSLSGTEAGGVLDAASEDLRATGLAIFAADGPATFGVAVSDGVRSLRTPETGTAKLDLAAATGVVSWPQTRDRITVELAHLLIPAPPEAGATAAKAPEAPAPKAIDPRDLPAITFHSADSVIYGHDLGEIIADVTKNDVGLTLENLEINMGPASVYKTTGTWVATPFGTDLKVAGKAHVRDGGRTLAALGFGEGIQGLHGEISFDADWPDAAPGAGLDKLVAHLDLGVSEGRVDNVNSLALKAFDLLTLHFLEMREKGLEIQEVKAKVVLRGTQLEIAEARVESSSAQVKVTGSVDLTKETLDANVALRLKISRTLNAVALGIVNPLLALGYLSQDSDFTVVKLDGLTEHSYRLTGLWSAPQVKLASGFFSH